MTATGRDLVVEHAMRALFQRGRVALSAYVKSLPPFAQPLGGARSVENMDVITSEDFDANASLIRRHVCINACMVHVLCEDGHLCAIVSPRSIKHW